MSGFFEIYHGGCGEIEEKKSRFIASVYKVTREEDAISIIEQLKKKYWDARHNCYAYIIGDDARIKKFSDDGEPSQTAGKPMLDVLESKKLRNVLVVVTRYFGGTLLGTGGLVRAYQGACIAGINASVVIEKFDAVIMEITSGYTENGKIKYVLANEGVTVISTDYTECVKETVAIPLER
ncbi:MAG: YigZ family protein, partial [Lachnospiraceae bacterium]|nr:YigZ family protein [Lachnospiraceae bacterium]